MALYEKPQEPLTVDENDTGRSVRFYEAPLIGGGTVFRCTLEHPGLAPSDGPVADLLPLAADMTSLRGLLSKMFRRRLTAAGMTVKP